ncbi:MAG: CfrBI family restriction endonuclease [Planctomycetes bacterium]|nr:CfrBI family restriction endonuclease [Planctomycetota bacterium]
MGRQPDGNALLRLVSPEAVKLLTAGGAELARRVGIDVVRGIVLDVLTGKNLRDSTEVLTRRRIAALNLAMVSMFLRGSRASPDFIQRLPHLATANLAQPGIPKAERWLAQWMIGLTDKALQNVLRDDPRALAEYRDQYIQACAQAIAGQAQQEGELRGVLETPSGLKAQVNWLFMTYLAGAVGAQTLAIRGSEKSAYGKLFEKLVLGSLLSILGFKHVPRENPQTLRGEFWLASRGERRESDATLLYEPGKGVRFDIGFIGRGNPEISLDKVTRFERETELGGRKWYMGTVIIVDRIGPNSRIQELARRVRGTIVQMSAAYWPQEVARILSALLGFKHELVKMRQEGIHDFLRRRMREVLLEEFLTPDAR